VLPEKQNIYWQIATFRFKIAFLVKELYDVISHKVIPGIFGINNHSKAKALR
jgi:hypothetical protein